MSRVQVAHEYNHGLFRSGLRETKLDFIHTFQILFGSRYRIW